MQKGYWVFTQLIYSVIQNACSLYFFNSGQFLSLSFDFLFFFFFFYVCLSTELIVTSLWVDLLCENISEQTKAFQNIPARSTELSSAPNDLHYIHERLFSVSLHIQTQPDMSPCLRGRRSNKFKPIISWNKRSIIFLWQIETSLSDLQALRT